MRWGFGNALALQAELPEQAETGIRWSPADPETHFAAAVLRERSFFPEDTLLALEHLERAASLASNNYLIWLELGNARDRAGEPASAEAAYRRALLLAPAYSKVQWALGNNLLRQGRTDEAFRLIGSAAAGDETYLRPAVAVAWNVFGGDASSIRRLLGENAEVRIQLILQLANADRLDEAVDLWKQAGFQEGSEEARKAGQQLLAALISSGRFRDALYVRNSLYAGTVAAIGKVLNGGFEENIETESSDVFGWRLAPGSAPQVIRTDGDRSSDAYSLAFVFGSGSSDFRTLVQTVAVEPGAEYIFSVRYRAEIDTRAEFKWSVTAVKDGKLLASTDLFLSGGGWRTAEAKVAIPGDVDGVEIAFTRAGCAGVMCSVRGILWMDDVALYTPKERR